MPEKRIYQISSASRKGKINRIILENNKVIGEERLLEDQGEIFLDFFDGKYGNLYAITDSGKLYRVSKK